MHAHDALGEQQAQVLEVALTPAAVALHLLEQRAGRLLPGSGQIEREPDRPARAAEQRRLDEVVAEDVAAERRLARTAAAARSSCMNGSTRMIALWPQ